MLTATEAAATRALRALFAGDADRTPDPLVLMGLVARARRQRRRDRRARRAASGVLAVVIAVRVARLLGSTRRDEREMNRRA
jgi:hypothetical protein